MAEKKKRDLGGKLPPVPIPTSYLETPKEHDLSHQRDERCVPIAHELVKMLAKMEKMPVGSHIKEAVEPPHLAYLPVVREFLQLVIDKNVKIVEITYIFSLVRQALEFVSDSMDETLNQQMNRVTELVYDLPLNNADEITVKDLNEVVMRKDKIQEVWKPIMEKPLDETKKEEDN